MLSSNIKLLRNLVFIIKSAQVHNYLHDYCHDVNIFLYSYFCLMLQFKNRINGLIIKLINNDLYSFAVNTSVEIQIQIIMSKYLTILDKISLY